MKNFENFNYYKNAIEPNAKVKNEFFEKLEKEFLDEITKSEKTAKFMEKFYGSGSDHFLQEYARRKAELIKNFNYHQSQFYKFEKDELAYQKKAEMALKLIQQKKLFNLQLQWRAGNIEIPGIEVCFDFVYWGHNILNCPFIPEITENEVKLMKEFLLKLDDPDSHELESTYDCQDYDMLMKIDEDGDRSDMFEWYEYFDSRMGTSMLLMLPDMKGQWEDFYRNILNEEHKRNNPEYKPLTITPDNRPFINNYGQDIIDYARYMETDPYILELFRYYEHELNERKNKPEEWRLDYAISILNSADRPIHFNPSKNWDEAIFLAAFQYENQRIAESVDFVYSQYLMYRDLDIVESDEDDRHNMKDFYEQMRKSMRENIKKAKELNGEIDDNSY